MGELLKSMDALEEKDRPGFFKDYYKMVRNSITNNQFNEFSKLTTDEDRVRFLFKIPAVHDIDIRPYYKGKSEREALDKKESGNKAFGRKNNHEALKLYSQAVVKAPVPSEENADPKKMTLYAICLANRSAALFHMKEYYYCIKDIDEALEHHYPKELKYKLYKRKGRLLVSYKRHEDARDAYRQALKWVDWAKVEREKRIEQQNEIQKWLRLFEGAKVCNNAPWEEVEVNPPIPELTGGPNEKFPSLSSKAAVQYDNKAGRHIVAKEDINVGDIICTDKPYASVLLFEEYGSHCQNCFALTKAPIPCKNCSGVLFCSVECRNASYFHKIECSIMDLLHGSGMSINCFLAFRMLTQTPLSYFLDIRNTLVDEDPKQVLEEDGIYDSTEFRRVYNLVRHQDQRTPEDFLHRALMAVFMVKTLKKTKYFTDMSSPHAETLSDTEAFVGGLLLRFLQIIQFNAHEISEFMMTAPKAIEGSSNKSLGAGIYSSLALFNHSCFHSQVRYFSGNRVITKAIYPILKGQDIPENYGPTYAAKTRNERRLNLFDRYWFECSCEACEKNWPTFKEMRGDSLTFKCLGCQSPIPVQTDTTNPFVQCQKCSKQMNILGVLKNLQNTEQTYKAGCKELQQFNLDKAVKLFAENINQLSMCLYPPYKDNQLTQEVLIKCYLTEGNKMIKQNEHKDKNILDK